MHRRRKVQYLDDLSIDLLKELKDVLEDTYTRCFKSIQFTFTSFKRREKKISVDRLIKQLKNKKKYKIEYIKDTFLEEFGSDLKGCFNCEILIFIIDKVIENKKVAGLVVYKNDIMKLIASI